MANNKITSNKVASLAAQVLNDKQASQVSKQLAGSALSQKNKGNETSEKIEKIASKILDNPSSSALSKQLAGSVLAQSNK